MEEYWLTQIISCSYNVGMSASTIWYIYILSLYMYKCSMVFQGRCGNVEANLILILLCADFRDDFSSNISFYRNILFICARWQWSVSQKAFIPFCTTPTTIVWDELKALRYLKLWQIIIIHDVFGCCKLWLYFYMLVDLWACIHTAWLVLT